MRICMRRVLQFRVNSMIQKAFIVRKKRKQSDTLSTPAETRFSELRVDRRTVLSDNALDVYFCLVSPLHHAVAPTRIVQSFSNNFLFREHLSTTNIGRSEHNAGRLEWIFTRTFINPLDFKAYYQKMYAIKTHGR